jgi:hypothetical protein
VVEPHPISGLFPVLPDDQLFELAEDIAKNGLREPIVLFDGMVLDGRNRLKACDLAGVEPRFEEYTGSDPFSYVVSCNLHRRHLSAEERKAIAKELILRDPSRTDTSVSQQARLSYVTTIRVRREAEEENPAVASATRFAKDGRRTQGRPRGAQPRRPRRWLEAVEKHIAADPGVAAELLIEMIVKHAEAVCKSLAAERRRKLLSMLEAALLGESDLAA